MRSYICINHERTPYKLVWANEDSKGVYLGFYGAAQGIHYSYHVDGAKHFELPGSVAPEQQSKGTPINDIDPFQQIAFQTYQLIPTTMYIVGNVYEKEDQASSAAVFLNESIFAENVLAIDAYVINRAKEADFIKFLYAKRPIEYRHKIIACNLFTLSNFPTHKIGLVILSGAETELWRNRE